MARLKLRWPFDTRADQLSRVDYTDKIIQAAMQAATAPRKKALGVAALGAQMWANSFAGSECDAPELVPHLAAIGNDLIRRGYWAARLDVEGSTLVFRPASNANAVGRNRWQLTLDTPDRQAIWTGSADRVVWLPWAHSPGRPWHSQSPLELAADTFSALGAATGHADQSLSSTLRWIFTRDAQYTTDQITEFLEGFERRLAQKQAALLTVKDNEVKPVTTDIADELPELYTALERSVRAGNAGYHQFWLVSVDKAIRERRHDGSAASSSGLWQTGSASGSFPSAGTRCKHCRRGR